MKFIDVELAGQVFRGQLLEDRSPEAARALWEALPIEDRAVHATISGWMIRTLHPAPFSVAKPDRRVGYQHPGQIVWEPKSGELVLCYGQGRVNDVVGPTTAIPVAQIGGDLTPFARAAYDLQFDGAKPLAIRRSADQSSPLAEPPEPTGRRIEVRLGDAVVTARLFEDVSPALAQQFAELLPLEGIASNTYASGPLTRFWNPNGGPEGETPLGEDFKTTHTVLYPGHLYYLPTRPWRGIRIAREATMMKGAAGGRGMPMAPLARFVGDWSAFYQVADRIGIEGNKPLAFRLRD